jgi:hypothetical protein
VYVEEFALAAAKVDLMDQWHSLRDAALGRFDGGYGEGSVTIAKRLAHFAGGGFLKTSWEAEAARQARMARVNTEEVEDVPKMTAGDVGAAGVGVGGEAAGAISSDTLHISSGSRSPQDGRSSEQEQQEQEQQQDASVGNLLDERVGRGSGGAAQAAAAGGEEEWGQDDEGFDGDAHAPAALVPVTSMLALAMWAVAVAQWWPVVPEAWYGLTNGLADVTLWQLATTYPDTPVTWALQMVRAGVERGHRTAGMREAQSAGLCLATQSFRGCRRAFSCSRHRPLFLLV